MSRFITLLLGICTLTFLSCTNDKESYPQDFKQNKEKFIKSYNLFLDANKISSTLPNLNQGEQIIQEGTMIQMMKEGIQISNDISSEFLNYLHPNLNDNFRNKLIKANELYLNGLSERNDEELSLGYQMQASELIIQWTTYWNDNSDTINQKLFPNNVKKSYWRMLFKLILADFIVVLVFSFMVVVLTLPMAPLSLLKGKINKLIFNVLQFPIIVITGIAQVYFWILWASFCAYTVRFYIDSPSVTCGWFYYLTAFTFVSAPIGYLGHKESNYPNTPNEKKNIDLGVIFYGTVAIVGFIVFCIWSNLMDYKLLSIVN